MISIKTDKEKTIRAIMRLDEAIEKGEADKSNISFIVSHDIMEINQNRYEVVEIKKGKSLEEFACRIVEVFDSKEAAQTCKDILCDMLYVGYEKKGN